MPDIGLFQQIYLGGVIAAFATFMVVLAGGRFYVNSAPRPQPAQSQTAEDNQRLAA